MTKQTLAQMLTEDKAVVRVELLAGNREGQRTAQDRGSRTDTQRTTCQLR